MSRKFEMGSLWIHAAAMLLWASCSVCGQDAADRRAVTVDDIVRMRRLGDPVYLNGGPSEGHTAIFSPDRSHFIMPLMRGVPENNTNEFTLLLFRTSRAEDGDKPQTLVVLFSSSNRPAIEHVRWINNTSIAFIGENSLGISQIYTLDIRNRRLRQLTHSPTVVVNFDIANGGKIILYAAQPAMRQTQNSRELLKSGIVVSSQTLAELLAIGRGGYDPEPTEGDHLFLLVAGRQPEPVPFADVVYATSTLSLSPDGLHALVEGFVRAIPASWRLYQDPVLHPIISAAEGLGSVSPIRRYSLLNISTRRIKPLIDAPLEPRRMAFSWRGGGRSILISGAYLPLDVLDAAERNRRLAAPYVVEVSLSGTILHEITDHAYRISNWDERSGRMYLECPYPWKKLPPVVYQGATDGWKEVADDQSNRLPLFPIRVFLKEDMNTPPNLYVQTPGMTRPKLLLELNPQFQKLQFAEEEILHWKSVDGSEMSGGLYLPLGFRPEVQYPLVIQTHGFLPDRFWPDGPWSSAFAAQPLAAHGILVLQVGTSANPEEERAAVNTTLEGPREMAGYAGAIDELGRRGWIDRDRVGIIGFSRTVYHVAYALTHSEFRFAAATLANGMDGGYLQYMETPPSGPDTYLVNGGKPFGAELMSWLRNSPGFNLDLVRTPIRIEEYGGASCIEGWEWFEGLTRLHKPVEMTYLPYGTHILVKPWEREVSQQGVVDWFRFWLKSEEDPDPGKRAQYGRWRALRAEVAAELPREGNRDERTP